MMKNHKHKIPNSNEISMYIKLHLPISLIVTSVIFAQWSDNSIDNTPVCDTPNFQYYSQNVSDGAGGAIITWSDQTSGLDVYAQRLDAFGFKLWGEDGIPVCTMPGAQFEPKAVSDGQGGIIVVWEDNRSDPGDIYAQRIDSTGTLLWGAEGLSICSYDSFQGYPKVQADSTGVYFVWQDYRNYFWESYCQKVSLSGDILWTIDGVRICQLDNFETRSYKGSIPDGYGGLVISWIDARNDTGDYHREIWAQRIGNTGELLWGDEGLLIAQEAHSSGAVAKLQRLDNNFIICVYTVRWLPNEPNDIYAQKIDLDGNLIWDENEVVICDLDNDQTPFAVHNTSNNEAIIVWSDKRYGPREIYAQKINSDGELLWAENGTPILSDGIGQRGRDSLLDKDGYLYVAWEEGRNIYTSRYDIYAQKVSPAGINIWPVNGIPVSTHDEDQGYPKITKSKMSIIVSWTDRRATGNSDIYAQQISIFGELGTIPLPNGDLNQDNITDVLDIIIIIDIILDNIIPTEYQQWVSDLNSDEIIDIIDILSIVDIILNDQ